MRGNTTPDSFARRNGLTLVFGALMLLTMVGHALAGWRLGVHAAESEHARPPTLSHYVASPAFLSSLFENWESEFLQMGLFVLLTVHFRQKGSSESRPMDPSDEHEEAVPMRARPWPVHEGGAWLRIYEHSLSAALLLLFALSFLGHWLWSWRQSVQAGAHSGHAVGGFIAYLASPELWFESMQNWQSEFLAVIAIVVLSIFLREKNSSQSKPVEAPNSKTGV